MWKRNAYDDVFISTRKTLETVRGDICNVEWRESAKSPYSPPTGFRLSFSKRRNRGHGQIRSNPSRTVVPIIITVPWSRVRVSFARDGPISARRVKRVRRCADNNVRSLGFFFCDAKSRV